jgi:hypothetical protein
MKTTEGETAANTSAGVGAAKVEGTAVVVVGATVVVGASATVLISASSASTFSRNTCNSAESLPPEQPDASRAITAPAASDDLMA